MLTVDGNHVFRAHFDGPSICPFPLTRKALASALAASQSTQTHPSLTTHSVPLYSPFQPFAFHAALSVSTVFSVLVILQYMQTAGPISAAASPFDLSRLKLHRDVSVVVFESYLFIGGNYACLISKH